VTNADTHLSRGEIINLALCVSTAARSIWRELPGKGGFRAQMGVRLSLTRKFPGGERLSCRPFRLAISRDPIALNVRLRTEIATHGGTFFFRRCSANRTLQFQRKIIAGHASLLRLFGQTLLVNLEHPACEHSAVCLPSNALTLRGCYSKAKNRCGCCGWEYNRGRPGSKMAILAS
jgi:hypothetical protein